MNKNNQFEVDLNINKITDIDNWFVQYDLKKDKNLVELDQFIKNNIQYLNRGTIGSLEGLKAKLMDHQIQSSLPIITKIGEIIENLTKGRTLDELPCEIHLKMMEENIGSLYPMALVSKKFRETAQDSSLIAKYLDKYSKYMNKTDILRFIQEVGCAVSHLHFQNLTKEELIQVVNNCPNLKAIRLIDLPITDHEVQYIAEKLPFLISLSLSGCCRITDKGAHSIADNLKNLQFLDLSVCHKITDIGIQVIAENLSTLQHLNLDRCQPFTDKTLQMIAENQPTLRLLRLNGSNITDGGIQTSTKKLTGLQNLSLYGCFCFTNEGFQAIADLKDLRTLQLYGFNNITDEVVHILAGQLPGLRALTLQNSQPIGGNNRFPSQITDEAACAIAYKFPNLKFLDLSNSDITDTGVQVVAENQPTLECLILKDCIYVKDQGVQAIAHNLRALQGLFLKGCPHVHGKGIQAIADNLLALRALELQPMDEQTDEKLYPLVNKLQNLQSLRLSEWKITNEGLQDIVEKLPGLQSLVLRDFHVTTEGIQAIARLSALTSLVITTHATDEELQVLIDKLPNLQNLALLNCDQITGKVFENSAKKLTFLKRLYLTNCYEFTDEAVKSLGELKTLQYLSLSGCDKITDAARKTIDPEVLEKGFQSRGFNANFFVA